jgi:hypothetical protein
VTTLNGGKWWLNSHPDLVKWPRGHPIPVVVATRPLLSCAEDGHTTTLLKKKIISILCFELFANGFEKGVFLVLKTE